MKNLSYHFEKQTWRAGERNGSAKGGGDDDLSLLSNGLNHTNIPKDFWCNSDRISDQLPDHQQALNRLTFAGHMSGGYDFEPLVQKIGAHRAYCNRPNERLTFFELYQQTSRNQ